MSSIAMHWARLMGGLQRATFYLLGRLALFILTYVDDILLLARGREATQALAVALLLMAAMGLPFLGRNVTAANSQIWSDITWISKSGSWGSMPTSRVGL